jgi:hypothetical protein
MDKNIHNYPWRPEQAPDIMSGRKVGSLRSCGYCGSMYPADVAAAIRAGAKGSWADFKYGWPHKAYFDGIPNPHAGMLESRYSTTHPRPEDIDSGEMIKVPTGRFDSHTGEPTYDWCEAGKPAFDTTYGKFYTEHLQDATAEDRKTIEQHLGLSFTFEGGSVSWRKFEVV